MENEPFKTLHESFTSECSPSNENRTSATYASERAKVLFGCYRRGDANDPETYVAAVASVLQHYLPEVVKAVTDPFSGLPGRKSEQGWSGLPDVADVKEACEAEVARQARLAAYARTRVNFNRHRQLPPEPPGARANLFVPAASPHYAALCRRAGREDAVWWKADEERPGIWIPMAWWDDVKAGRT